MKSIAILLIAALALWCHSPAGAQTLSALKPGDPVSIELKVPAEDAPNVTAKYNISGTGTVKVPYLDREIMAAGLSTTELARRIEQAYKAAEIYTNPTINVTTITPQDYSPHVVTVGGEVKTGGREVPLRDGMRLYQAIMAAGGFTEFADVKRVKIIRGTRSMVFDMRKLDPGGSNNPILMDGDTIHVPQD
jgi:protein involved in polysaccharide export with SLBB domain